MACRTRGGTTRQCEGTLASKCRRCSAVGVALGSLSLYLPLVACGIEAGHARGFVAGHAVAQGGHGEGEVRDGNHHLPPAVVDRHAPTLA